MPPRQFPPELVQPMPGEIVFFDLAAAHPLAGTWAIKIPIEPFSSDDEYSTDWRAGSGGPNVISTEVSLDFINLPGKDLAHLVNRSFSFPTNPADGYIDGSIYLCGSHNPVDVTKIEFGQAVGNSIAATVTAKFVFEYELRDVLNVEATIAAVLAFRRA